MKPYSFLLASLALTAFAATGTTAVAAKPASFPFVIPWNDSSKTILDVSNPNPAPINEARRLTIKDGHYYDTTGRRVKFLGTNITAGGCFPTKKEAPIIAARLRKFGFNCIRLHHMDSEWATPNLFYLSGGSYGRKTDKLSPESLDRLDYFIYQLKQNGIYVDINLHVGRAFTALDGLPDTGSLHEMGKVEGYFEPYMIERQKLFANQLLTHMNPYTKTRYTEDPSVAIIEITNEDSILTWVNEIYSLPDHYRNILETGWNRYLQQKYASSSKMLKRGMPLPNPLEKISPGIPALLRTILTGTLKLTRVLSAIWISLISHRKKALRPVALYAFHLKTSMEPNGIYRLIKLVLI
jgi:hypothetical protein